jgi:hypothetical protein
MMRVIVNGVSFYTTESRVKNGVGDFSLINTAVRLCYEEMGKSVGLAKNFTLYDHKMNKTMVSVQIDRL